MKSFYTNPESNKEVLASECTNYICPFSNSRSGRVSYCNGSECMAWKWTGFIQEQVTMVVKSDTKDEFDRCLYSDEVQNKRTFTHGCCGLVYTGEIETGEIKPNEII